MCEWLSSELLSVKTPRFHLVDGPADEALSKAISLSGDILPESYKRFVLQFGNAKLYRRAYNGYTVGVFAGPRESVLKDGTRILHLGFNDGLSIYIKPIMRSTGIPIYGHERGVEKKVSEDFGDWFDASCARARKSIGRERWEEVLRGPEPFTTEETRILETRSKIRWAVSGVDSSGDIIFNVKNLGIQALPIITIGIRSKDGRLNGSIRLRIGHIGPGQSGVVHADCYKDFRHPMEIEAFEMPDPQPEDRNYFGEFDLLP